MLDHRARFVPTYGNTLMGLACSRPLTPEDGWSITYHAPQPRAVLRVVDPDDTVVRVAPDPEGALVRVETFREYMGYPQTTALWTDLRSRIRAVAGARGLTVSDGPPVSYVRGPLLDDRNARWSRTG